MIMYTIQQEQQLPDDPWQASIYSVETDDIAEVSFILVNVSGGWLNINLFTNMD